MKKAVILLANGFEEIEGLTVVDLLRRADIEITTVSIESDLKIKGRSNIIIEADAMLADVISEQFDMLILPGGAGVHRLKENQQVIDWVLNRHQKKQWLAAICAAPSVVLGQLGLLKGLRATCYPTEVEGLIGAIRLTDSVVVDGHIITSRGLGTSIDFALKIIEVLAGSEAAEQIRESIVYKMKEE